MPVRIILALAFVLALAACSKGADSQKAAQAAGVPLLVSAEDLHVIRNSALSSGPAITGSIQPERRADLRAEVQAIVLQLAKENGDAVKRGDLLVRLDETVTRANLAIITKGLTELYARKARLGAERDGADSVPLPKSGFTMQSAEVDGERAVVGIRWL